MKKVVALILCFVVFLSLLSSIDVFAAPVGTAINSASDFYNMTPGGTYYLNKNITINKTYMTAFEGVFDGNGYTVTTTAPLFNDFSGEVKNLTIKGELYYSGINVAAFAIISSKGFNATNCVNNANVTVLGNAKLAAGFVTECYNSVNPMTFTNCVNNGMIYIDSSADEKPRAGGLGAIIDNLVLNNCENNGGIYVKGNIGIAGGLVARVCLNSGAYTAEAFNCRNTGHVLVEDTYIGKDGVSPGNGGSDAGGIFGYVGCSGNYAWYRIWGCVNTGDINAPYRAGGMAAYVYGSGSNQFLDLQFCINTGDIIYGRTQKSGSSDIYDYAGPFAGYTSSIYTTIKYNIDTGKLIRREGTISANESLAFVNIGSAVPDFYDFKGNYILNYQSYKYSTYSGNYPENIREIEATAGIFSVTLAEIKSGKVCYEIMLAAKHDDYGYANSDTRDPYAFYQNIGADDYPTTDSSHATVYYSGGVYSNKGSCTHNKITEHRENVKEATCTNSGSYTLVKICSVCNEELSRTSISVSSKGHTPGPAATETSPQVCTVCNVVLVPKIEHKHSWSTSWVVDEYNHWINCTTCGEISEFNAHAYDNDCDGVCNICFQTRNVSDHSFGEWDIIVEPTQTNEGLKAHICSSCGYSETEKIPVLDKIDTELNEDSTSELVEDETDPSDTLIGLDEALGCSSFISVASMISVLAAGIIIFKKKD